MRGRTFVGAVLLATVWLYTGCSTPRGRAVDDRFVTQQLDFLVRNASRDEIEARLGAPAALYEQGAVVSYRLYTGVDGQVMTASRSAQSAGTYTLVLQYGPDGRVTRHALLQR